MSLPIGSLQHKVCTETRRFGINYYLYTCTYVYIYQKYSLNIYIHILPTHTYHQPPQPFVMCAQMEASESFRDCGNSGVTFSVMDQVPWDDFQLENGPCWLHSKGPHEGKRCRFWDRMHEKNPEIIDWPTMKPGVAMITFWGSCFFFYMTYQGALKWWYIIIHLLLWCLRGDIHRKPPINHWLKRSIILPPNKEEAGCFFVGPKVGHTVDGCHIWCSHTRLDIYPTKLTTGVNQHQMMIVKFLESWTVRMIVLVLLTKHWSEQCHVDLRKSSQSYTLRKNPQLEIPQNPRPTFFLGQQFIFQVLSISRVLSRWFLGGAVSNLP